MSWSGLSTGYLVVVMVFVLVVFTPFLVDELVDSVVVVEGSLGFLYSVLGSGCPKNCACEAAMVEIDGG